MNETDAETEIEGQLLLAEVSLPSARGGRKPSAPLTVEIVRGLTPDEAPRLLEAVGSTTPNLLQLRATHHALARQLALGLPQAEVALITGYSESYISTLHNDPAFAELVSHYTVAKDLAFVDVVERMRLLGLHTLEELQDRIAREPDKWTKRELMDLAELMLGKGGAQGQAPQGAGAGGPGVVVNVKFVTPGANGAGAKVIENTPVGGD